MSFPKESFLHRNSFSEGINFNKINNLVKIASELISIKDPLSFIQSIEKLGISINSNINFENSDISSAIGFNQSTSKGERDLIFLKGSFVDDMNENDDDMCFELARNLGHYFMSSEFNREKFFFNHEISSLSKKELNNLNKKEKKTILFASELLMPTKSFLCLHKTMRLERRADSEIINELTRHFFCGKASVERKIKMLISMEKIFNNNWT